MMPPFFKLGRVFVLTLSGAMLGCSGGGANPIVEAIQEADPGGGSDTGGDSGELSATGGSAEIGGAGAAAGQEPQPGDVPGTGGVNETGGSDETGGVGGGECLLVPNYLGTVRQEDNEPCHIQGSWYEYDDCPNSSGCSTVESPEAGSFPNEGGVMCTWGSTAALANEAERATKWGAGIGLKLNEAPESELEGPIGDLPVKIVGFRFTVTLQSDVSVPEDFIVSFRTRDNEREADLLQLPDSPGQQTVRLQDAQPPEWVNDPLRPPLDPSQVVAIQFQVPSKVNEPIPFNYCISELTALYEPKQE